MCQICSKHNLDLCPYHYGPLLRAALALKYIFFLYDCACGWYLYLVSRFEPVLTCRSRDIHVNTQKNQKIPKVYSLVWYHCMCPYLKQPLYLSLVHAVHPLLLECSSEGSGSEVTIDCRTNRPPASTLCSFDGGLSHQCKKLHLLCC